MISILLAGSLDRVKFSAYGVYGALSLSSKAVFNPVRVSLLLWLVKSV